MAAATTALPRRDVIPRLGLWAAAGVLAMTLAGVAVFRIAGIDARSDADARPVAQRALHFKDLSDGGVAVIDGASGATLDTMRGEQGFLRGTLRALARERKQRGLGSEAPLQLIARADGRLTLADPVTGARIDLESFGPTNAAVFSRWLPSGARP